MDETISSLLEAVSWPGVNLAETRVAGAMTEPSSPLVGSNDWLLTRQTSITFQKIVGKGKEVEKAKEADGNESSQASTSSALGASDGKALKRYNIDPAPSAEAAGEQRKRHNRNEVAVARALTHFETTFESKFQDLKDSVRVSGIVVSIVYFLT